MKCVRTFLPGLFLLCIVTTSQAQWANGQSADLVLGQSDFNSETAGGGAAGVLVPIAVAIDPTSGKLFVADFSNNRVLRWPSVSSLTSGMSAEAVLGQTNFDTVSAATAKDRMWYPAAIVVDWEGRLWVADAWNNRVLRFDDASSLPPGAEASGVLGQPDFTTNTANISRSGMNYTRGITIDKNGTLYVADQTNNRVLRFDRAAGKTNGAEADGVLGQPDFMSNAGATTRSGMSVPRGVALDRAGRLFVATSSSNRVLRFDNAASKPNGADADAVLGQPDFTGSTKAAGSGGMNQPIGLSVDATGRLYVTDYGNHRLLWFDAAASKVNGGHADGVLGQTDFTTDTASLSATGMKSPWGLFVDDARGTLWVADAGHNRVLRFTAAAPFGYPPAPFYLSYVPVFNPTLYRMDRVGDCPDGRLEKDQPLRLHWQPSTWKAPNESRNDPSDTTRYELNVIIDSVGATASKTLIVRFPAEDPLKTADPGVTLSAELIYTRIFRPPVPWPLEPDTIVMRVNWFVRAYNSIGSTWSDTAGVTIRSNPMPQPPLVLSYNRPPDPSTAPVAVTPLHNETIRDVTAATPPINIIWTQVQDRNILAGIRIGGFKLYNPVVNGWIDDPTRRTVDTLFYQWIGTVVHTSPAGTGAPIGSFIVRNTGSLSGLQLLGTDLSWLLGGFTAPSSTAADTVVIDWQVYVHDFWWYGGEPMEEITFRYRSDGTLKADTAAFSRFGCRPHELVSKTYRFTLVRGGATGIPVPVGNASVFSLSQNYPNPFNHSGGSTIVEFDLPAPAMVNISVFDMLGSPLRTLVERRMDAGTHVASWDGTDALGRRVPPGAYICRMLSAGSSRTIMVTVTR